MQRRLVVNSTLDKVSELSGHVFEMPMPCLVYGLFIERTGTVVFESVYCDGHLYYAADLSAEELQKFLDELKHEAVYGEF